MTVAAESRKTSNAAIDMAKFIFSILIATLHAGVDLGTLSPLYRLAVPCFFLFSSFFLFSKLSRTDDDGRKREILIDFVLRNVKLLLFWMVVQLPLSIIHWHWGEPALITDMLYSLRGLLFGSVFAGSWYINATVIGCCMVYWLSRKLPCYAMLVIGGLAYLACLMFSNYYGWVSWCLPLRYALTGFITLFSSVVTGFPAGLLWIVVGKMIAEKNVVPRKSDLWLFLGGAIALLAEKWMVDQAGIALRDDCYLFLIPTCCGLFQWLRGIKWCWSPSVRFRSLSTIIYVSHGSGLTLARFWSDSPLVAVGVVLLLAGMLYGLILLMEKYRPFKWMKYIY